MTPVYSSPFQRTYYLLNNPRTPNPSKVTLSPPTRSRYSERVVSTDPPYYFPRKLPYLSSPRAEFNSKNHPLVTVFSYLSSPTPSIFSWLSRSSVHDYRVYPDTDLLCVKYLWSYHVNNPEPLTYLYNSTSYPFWLYTLGTKTHTRWSFYHYYNGFYPFRPPFWQTPTPHHHPSTLYWDRSIKSERNLHPWRKLMES